MPIRTDRTKHRRRRGHYNELDWFAEDDWEEHELAAFEDVRDDWYPGLWETSGDGDLDPNEQDRDDDPLEGWAAIRPRRRARSRR